MTPTDPLEAAWEDMLSELRFGDDTEVAYVEEVVAKHRPLIEAATPRPAGVDVERERELRKRLTRHHRDQHVTALTCRSCIAALTGSEE